MICVSKHPGGTPPRTLPHQHLLARSALTVDEELGSFQLAGNTRRLLPACHWLPILPGPGDPQWGRALDVTQQAHAVPDFDRQVPQGLGKVRGSWRREQRRRGSGRSNTPGTPQQALYTAKPGDQAASPTSQVP